MNPAAPRSFDDFCAMEARLTARVSARMLELAAVARGMRVLDIATGRGEPALLTARRVGETGRVVGLDTNAESLAWTREAAASASLANLELHVLDATDAAGVAKLGSDFDVATARWGLMYMTAPERALAAIHGALKKGGVLSAAFWAEPERVAWATLPLKVTRRFIELPEPASRAPSAFRYGTVEAITSDLSQAGFTVEHVEELEIAVVETESGSGFVAWVRALLGKLAASVPEPRRAAWAEELAREAEAYRRGDLIRIGGVTRLVLARRS
jgi:ubiquinone/menaquinone biosynthesis C-methylase UbiE